MGKIISFLDNFLLAIGLTPARREQAGFLVFKLLQVSLWSLGAAVWLFRIGVTALHGHFWAAGAWLLGGLLLFVIAIPSRCLYTLYLWTMYSVFVTFTPWGIKIGAVLLCLPFIAVAVALPSVFAGELRELVQDREHRTEVRGGIQSAFLAAWILAALLILVLSFTSVFSNVQSEGWHEGWVEREQELYPFLLMSGLALASGAWCVWRLRRRIWTEPPL